MYIEKCCLKNAPNNYYKHKKILTSGDFDVVWNFTILVS